jgi:methylated-DNA-protein-cysteine methyltransferase-like protein
MTGKTKGRNAFEPQVLKIVRAIPRGRVLTYGEVALIIGTPRGARQVGRVLYYSGRKVPWQRVVNRFGGLSTYKIGSGEEQRHLLEREGVRFERDGTLKLSKYQWRPNQGTIERLRLSDEVASRINAKLPMSK